ncbi:uncharacterized protein (DUF2345 family), partial [Pseudacidovorax sp. 1753]|uniref:DUF2345 domain-containing protein n=1 Tax=Pseudacidovorax sp. 1753 TaxID=3156419 RepID=UPI00339AF1F8
GVTIRSTTGSIVISAPVSVTVNGGGSFTEWSNAGITHGTPGTWVEHAASHVQMGPLSRPLQPQNFEACDAKERHADGNSGTVSR